jgi:hypothetical protein
MAEEMYDEALSALRDEGYRCVSHPEYFAKGNVLKKYKKMSKKAKNTPLIDMMKCYIEDAGIVEPDSDEGNEDDSIEAIVSLCDEIKGKDFHSRSGVNAALDAVDKLREAIEEKKCSL